MPRPATAMPDFDFVHTGPETLAGRYMRMFWQPVYRSDDLKAGRAVPLRILKEDFTLFRGRSGSPVVAAPPCCTAVAPPAGALPPQGAPMKFDVPSIAADESEFGVTIKTSRTKRSRVRL